MGQKVSPIGLRIGINKDWESRWYAPKKDFSAKLGEDVKIRNYVKKNLADKGVAKVEIERNKKRCEVIIHSAKPGVLIGKGGEEIEKLRDFLEGVGLFLPRGGRRADPRVSVGGQLVAGALQAAFKAVGNYFKRGIILRLRQYFLAQIRRGHRKQIQRLYLLLAHALRLNLRGPLLLRKCHRHKNILSYFSQICYNLRHDKF